uniref:Uncharacterized protein n=1 Tax=Sphaerodactylus townsendi TaxID=933632 RepID=A0ACB8E5M6_9SAUR
MCGRRRKSRFCKRVRDVTLGAQTGGLQACQHLTWSPGKMPRSLATFAEPFIVGSSRRAQCPFRQGLARGRGRGLKRAASALGAPPPHQHLNPSKYPFSHN